jgi:carbon monoxide dehydrogenase subunit G
MISVAIDCPSFTPAVGAGTNLCHATGGTIDRLSQPHYFAAYGAKKTHGKVYKRMDFGGRYLFGAKRAEVWAALNDVRVLGAVIPGCQSIEWTGPATLDLRIKVNFGVIQPVFDGELTLSDIHPAQRYRLTGGGKGGLLGRAQAAADITLVDEGGGTILSFDAAGKADGGIMRLGKALIGNSAQKVIDGFFAAIGTQMGVNVTALPRG